MQLSKHFSLAEMTCSDYAARHEIDNSASAEIIDNLRDLCLVLEQARAILEYPLRISSGYRSAKVNAGVGGSKGSYHMSGLAVDFTCPVFGAPAEVCRELIKHSLLEFDKLILEFGQWVHLQIPRQDEAPRLTAWTIRSSREGYLEGII